MAIDLQTLITVAWDKRQALHRDPDLDVYRVFHGFADGLPGLNIDLYDRTILIDYEIDLVDQFDALRDVFLSLMPEANLLAKASRKLDLPLQQRFTLLAGENEERVVVNELGIRFAIHPYIQHNAGLFLDARDARVWLRQNSDGSRILNLFAFTGSLGLAARIGGAKSVTHVDKSRIAFAQCEENYRLNELSMDARDYLVGDIYQHLPKAVKRGKQFGGIILDPPPFVQKRSSMKHHPKAQDFEKLMSYCGELLAPDGWILCLFHEFGKRREDFEDMVIRSTKTPLRVEYQSTCGIDFNEVDEDNRLRISVFRRVA
ncbi:MAG: class I SAM-dependent methyltransferase [Myxococcota bacterium]